MKHLESSYTNTLTHTHTHIYIYGLLIWGRGWGGGGNWARDLVFVRTAGWDVWDAWRVHAVTKLCLGLIIDKSMVGIILCLIVLRN